MQTKTYPLNNRTYLTTYVSDDYRVDTTPVAKPAIIICPGGGWMYLSEREGEPIAIEFAKRGYFACVLHYAISEEPAAPGDFHLVQQALGELESSYKLLLELQQGQQVDAKRISVLGFSAGGQLAALFAAKHPELYADILCYPLLDLGDERSFVRDATCPAEHRDIMERCFGVLGVCTEEKQNYSSIDPVANIAPSMPPTFLWHGASDDLVRPTGTLNYAKKLMERGVRTELHIYDNCGHGISLGTRETAAVEKEINDYGAVWFAQLLRWMEELGNEKE